MLDPALLHIPESFDTERLTIRAPRVRDAAELCRAIEDSLDELRPWMPWAEEMPTILRYRRTLRKGRRNWLARKDFWLMLLLKGTNTIIGGSGLHRIDWSISKVEIGYWVRTPFAGKGYITEAVSGITAFAFEHFKARRVEIRMDSRNERSWRVAERCEFQLEGILRNDRRAVDGSLGDTRVYAKIL